MNKLFSIATLSIAIFFFSCQGGTSQQKTNLSATEFAAKIKELPDAAILDVRTPAEYGKGHIANSKNWDWYGDFQNQVASLDKSKPVLVYCLSGARSASAANMMRSSGFKEVYELQGGIMQWRGANLPETTEVASAKPAGMTKQQFDAQIVGDKVVLVDFYADWCEPCKRMKPYLDEISSSMANKVVLIRVNADDNQDLLKEMGIDALPVLQVYKNKALTWKNVGYIGKEEVVKQLN